MLNFAITEFYEVRLSTILGSSTERASRKLNGRGLESEKVDALAALLTSNVRTGSCHIHRGLPLAQSRLGSDANVPSMAWTFLPALLRS